MATRKSYHERPSYLYLGEERKSSISAPSYNQFELEEFDVWNNSNEIVSSETNYPIIPNLRSSKKINKKAGQSVDRGGGATATARSLPVNVPDWSKILGDEYNGNPRRDSDDDDNDDGDDQDDDDDHRLPPHEYLARTRTASFSVHEGIGRTLKGRDLSRVRNAIWKRTGFED